MKKFAIIAAGGSGSRMGGSTPKQLQLLAGKPLIWHTLRAFLQAYDDLAIILVLPVDRMPPGELVIGLLEAEKPDTHRCRR